MPISSIEALTAAPGMVVAINNDGQILFENTPGVADLSTATSSLYLQTGQSVVTIGNFSGQLDGVHLNNAGNVAWQGEVYTPIATNEWIGTDFSGMWENGKATTLPALISGLYTLKLTALDDASRAYGYSEFTGSLYNGNTPPDWVYQSGTLSVLPSNVAISGFVAEPLEFIAGNANGDLAGSAFTSGPVQQKHLLLWKNGAMVDCGTLSSNYVAIDAFALNSSDQIVGKEQTAYGISTTTAFISEAGTILDLPTLGTTYVYNEAFAINDQGIIVGRAGTSLVSSVAVLWQNNTIVDLNSLLPANSGWVLKDAVGINDHNQIVGTGTYNGNAASFELTFVPQSFTAAAAVGQKIFSITPIADTTTNISANLDGLQAIAKAGELGAVTFTDSGVPTLFVTIGQMTSDTTALADISASYHLGVKDTAAKVSADLDGLQALVTSGKVSSITLSDSAALSVSPAQLTSDAAAIKAISGSFAVTAVFSGTGSQYSITPSGDGTSFTISGNGITDQVSGVQALQFSDHTDIVAAQPGKSVVTSGNITELYSAVFGRTPDLGGLSFYQDFLAKNPSTPLQQFAQWFLASSEYQNNPAHAYAQTVTGNQQFITDSYQNLLHRTPSASEVSFYENNVIAPALANLTPGTAAYGAAAAQAYALTLVYFSQSSEFVGDVQVTAQNPTSAQHWLILI